MEATVLSERPHPTPHRRQMKPGRCRDPLASRLAEYRRIRDELRQTTDEDREYELQDALDSVWFRMTAKDRRVVDREYLKQ